MPSIFFSCRSDYSLWGQLAHLGVSCSHTKPGAVALLLNHFCTWNSSTICQRVSLCPLIFIHIDRPTPQFIMVSHHSKFIPCHFLITSTDFLVCWSEFLMNSTVHDDFCYVLVIKLDFWISHMNDCYCSHLWGLTGSNDTVWFVIICCDATSYCGI